MTHDKERIVEWIDANENGLINFLQKIVQVPSDNPSGDCLPIASFLYEQLDQLGFRDKKLIEVNEADVKEAGMISHASVLASSTFGEGEGTSIVLNAHGDVVPPGLGWSVDPYGGEVIDGKMYGRGVAVSKSDIAAYTFAVLALQQAGITGSLQGSVDLAFTFDEEIGGELGPKRLLDEGVIRADQAIVAGFTYAAVNAHNGCLHFEVTTTGKSAHAALPHTGYDAIEATSKILTRLYDYRESLKEKKSAIPGIDTASLVVGLISGGINTNVVPDECKIRVDRRLIPEENDEIAEKEFREVIHNAIASCAGITVNIRKILHAKSFGQVPKDSPLITTLSDNWKMILNEKEELEVNGVPIYTDARHFYAAGIPTVMFGVGPKKMEDANGHRADENIRLDDLLIATKVIACTLYDLLA